MRCASLPRCSNRRPTVAEAVTYLNVGDRTYMVFSRKGGDLLGDVYRDGPGRWFIHPSTTEPFATRAEAGRALLARAPGEADRG